MNARRTVAAVVALAALSAAGCMLTSGQFVADYALPTPLVAASAITLTSVSVDLNKVSEYKDHKDDLKRVDDVALLGDFHNNTASAASVEAWIVPGGATNLTASQLAAQGEKVWGPLAVAANASEHVDWNRSAALFTGRQSVIDEVKADGRFSLYVIANGAFDLTLTDGAVIAVFSAAK
jgi:hypothetical protein